MNNKRKKYDKDSKDEYFEGMQKEVEQEINKQFASNFWLAAISVVGMYMFLFLFLLVIAKW